MRIVLAPDKFRGSLTGADVARALADGLRLSQPQTELTLRPLADGGEGTVAAAIAAGYTEVPIEAEGPTGEPVRTSYAAAGSRAVVELAAVCGALRVPDRRPHPLDASTYGLGQVLSAAILGGARDIILGLGGSVSTDGGAGMVAGLGGSLLDSAGHELPRGGGGLVNLDRVDLAGLPERLDGVRVVVASQSDTPLLGADGTAATFGPQKGATAEHISRLERGLRLWGRLVTRTVGRNFTTAPGAGEGGGCGFAALALLNASLRPGAEVMMDLIDLPAALAGADLVITGEGSLDERSLSGKAPVGVTAAAVRAGVPVVAVVGRNRLSDIQLRDAGFAGVYPLTALEADIDRSMAETPELLRRLGNWIGREWGGGGG